MLNTVISPAVGWGLIILSQDALTKLENWVVSCIATF